jgi:hypothetical protein
MSFFDKVAKAVTDTVDKGKKEVDQFMRVQKVRGEISQVEQQIQAAAAEVQGIKVLVAEKAIAMLQQGTLTSPELQGLAAPLAGVESKIAAHRAVIAEKQQEIARIEAEGHAPAAPSVPPQAAAAPVPPPPVPAPPIPAPPVAAAPAVPPLPVEAAPAVAPPPVPTPAERACPSCGAKIAAAGAFCTECGTKLA